MMDVPPPQMAALPAPSFAGMNQPPPTKFPRIHEPNNKFGSTSSVRWKPAEQDEHNQINNPPIMNTDMGPNMSNMGPIMGPNLNNMGPNMNNMGPDMGSNT